MPQIASSASRNEQPLSSVGYWNEPLPGSSVAGSSGLGSSEELCAAADPAADFRWHGLSCGGLEVASFICELPGESSFRGVSSRILDQGLTLLPECWPRRQGHKRLLTQASLFQCRSGLLPGTAAWWRTCPP